MKKPIISIFIFITVFSCFFSECVYSFESLSIGARFNHFVLDKIHPLQLAAGDINGDGFPDLFGAVDFESGKKIGLYWYLYPTWKRHTISEGVNFRADDMECGDVDNDGDPDLVVTVDEDGKTFWYENPRPSGDPATTRWKSHRIGLNGDYVKDVELGDIDGDGRLDVIVRGHQILNVFKQNNNNYWSSISIPIHNKEGLDIGDIDNDGDLDIVLNGYWIETTKDLFKGQWKVHSIDRKWYTEETGHWEDNCANVVVEDMDQDGRNDILLCHSEKTGWPISWYSSFNPRTGPWYEHVVTPKFNYCETLQAFDMNKDGSIDVVAGEMKKSEAFGDLVIFYQNQIQEEWVREVVAERIGIYDVLVVDIGSDKDYDIIGSHDYNKPPTNWWENKTNDNRFWQYHSIDQNRPESQFGKMGLVFCDVNNDGWQDIAAGSFVYINPAGNLKNDWERIRLQEDVDVYFALDIDNDHFSDLIGISKDNHILWLEADKTATNWSTNIIGKVPEGRTQGYTTGQIVPGGRPELVFTRSHYLYYLEVPAPNEVYGPWQMIMVSDTNEEEGVAAGDMDRDGDIDLVTVSRDGHHVIWLENPGNGTPQWPQHTVGLSDQWTDRIALNDINEDGRLDIIATQENRDWEINAHIYWYEAPEDPKISSFWKHVSYLPYSDLVMPFWNRKTVATLRSVNSMDIGDINHDGKVDIIVAEHTDQTSAEGAPDNLTVAYHKGKKGRHWSPYVMERGPHASHLGSRLVDLDNDGDFDVVSLGWKQYKCLHLWINQEQRK